MLFIDSLKTYAYCLWDASIVFPEAIRNSVRTPFKAKAGVRSIISGMSTESHAGMSIDGADTQHYWAYNLTTEQESGGTLIDTIYDTTQLLHESIQQNDNSRTSAVCGRLSHLIIDGYVLLNTIHFEPDGNTVRGRLLSDVETHVEQLPFLWDAITAGDNFELNSPLLNKTAIKISLNAHRQDMINIANGYLYGNGWTAVSNVIKRNYNLATNLLARTVLSAYSNDSKMRPLSKAE